MARPVIHVKPNKKGKWYVTEVSSNGKTVNVAQAYSTKSNAVRAGRNRARKLGAKLDIQH